MYASTQTSPRHSIDADQSPLRLGQRIVTDSSEWAPTEDDDSFDKLSVFMYYIQACYTLSYVV